MIRTVGMGLIFVAMLTVSRYIEAGRLRRLREEEAWLRFLSALHRELSCYARPLSAFAATYEDETLGAVGFPDRLREAATLGDALCAVRGRLSSSPPFLRVLETFGASFGRGYRDGELRALAVAIDEAGAIYKKEEEDAPRRRRLSRTLCVSLSLAIVMLLL